MIIKRDKNNGWKMKPELGAIFNGKYHSKYKCSFPESIVELKNKDISKYFLTSFAFLFIHPVQLSREFFTSCPIEVHYLALKIFT